VLALAAVPVSIAVTESLLALSILFRLVPAGDAVKDRLTRLRLPRAFWFWLAWAALEVLAWLHSPEMRAGKGEIRHLFLIASLFLLVPSLDQATDRMNVWRGIFLTSSLSSMVLIGTFAWRVYAPPQNVDPIIYLRTGGLLHHWMIYATVEILVFAGLLAFWHHYPEERRRWTPVFAITVAAITVSLTRALWISCLLLLVLHLIWRRSRWIWAVPFIPVVLLSVAPSAVRARVADSAHLAYYSNAERLQMLRVGLQMIRSHPLMGVGPGRVDGLYLSYLSPTDPVPAYHGHLHNNLVQLAAEFGLPVAGTALLFVLIVCHDLRRRYRSSVDREERFLCHAALLGLAGFLGIGMFDYTYGHSLGLIFLSFVLFTPLMVSSSRKRDGEAFRPDRTGLFDAGALAATDCFLSFILIVASLPVMISAGGIIRMLSKRSPLVAHLRVGRNGGRFWAWKLRTMWPQGEVPLPAERGWLQRIDAPPLEDKRDDEPRITSRFAAFCRRHSLDELPQLFQVFLGQMSLVGPRPVTRGELDRHYADSAREVLAVRPGLTGYWQTQGRNALSYRRRVDLDRQLVRDLSVGVYFRVLLRTIPEVLNGKNAR
jgi:exopolysaccharide production protein ExoY